MKNFILAHWPAILATIAFACFVAGAALALKQDGSWDSFIYSFK